MRRARKKAQPSIRIKKSATNVNKELRL
jgi:hypothetical protein